MKTPPRRSGYPLGVALKEYQLKEAPSKVIHSLPSSSSSTWNLF